MGEEGVPRFATRESINKDVKVCDTFKESVIQFIESSSPLTQASRSAIPFLCF